MRDIAQVAQVMLIGPVKVDFAGYVQDEGMGTGWIFEVACAGMTEACVILHR